MSHFALHVLIQKPTKIDDLETYAKGQVARLLAPFDENLEVAPYQTPCYCVGQKAKLEAAEKATRTKGTWEAIRGAFKARYPELAAALDEALADGRSRG